MNAPRKKKFMSKNEAKPSQIQGKQASNRPINSTTVAIAFIILSFNQGEERKKNIYIRHETIA